ncbi:BTAD domain-containing putative transcriptional regulator [Actinoplanes sp. NPDC051851]|uniref:AfsR/SARP family transcriptional regulator n=1 Tax=Actinoplanes sp. NPDC051851 TaxID=3154753 RepID=UPI0034286D34
MVAHVTAPMLAARFLGDFRVMIDGVPVDTVSRRRTRHLLAYLLTHRRAAVHRDVLAEVFWPGATPERARNNLHVSLTGVRQALRAAHPLAEIERRYDTYRIGPATAVWSDVEQFARHRAAGLEADRRGDRDGVVRAYESACQLHEGDFLAEDPYLEWAAPIREALRLDVIDVQTRLAEAYLERGAYGSATLLARRLLEDDPCNETVSRLLMTCYATAGQRHLALSQYHRLAERLWTTHRVRPSAGTTAYFERLRDPRGGVASVHGNRSSADLHHQPRRPAVHL